MTNFEWLKKEITVGDLVNMWFNEKAPWCDVCNYDRDCVKCIKDWCAKEHQEPMPKIEDGMFVKCRYDYDNEEGYEDYIGFVFKGTVIFQDGKFSMHAIEENRIIEIYNSTVHCFNQCRDCNIAWRKTK